METPKENLVRCSTCNSYWRVIIPPNVKTYSHMFRCPRGHFSEFALERLLVVDASAAPTMFVPIDQTEDDILLQSELEWIKKQTAELYDCGFFAMMLGDKSPIPILDLESIQHPDTASKIYDADGREFQLAISPNGISYYVLVSKFESKEEKKNADSIEG